MPMRLISFKIDEELLESLDKLSKRLHRCRSDLIREAIVLLLEKYYDNTSLHKDEKPRIERVRIW